MVKINIINKTESISLEIYNELRIFLKVVRQKVSLVQRQCVAVFVKCVSITIKRFCWVMNVSIMI